MAAAIAPLHRAAGPIGIFELVLPAEPAVARGAGHALLEGIKAAVRSAALDGFCAPRRSRGCIGAQHEGGQQDGCHGEGAHGVPPQSSPTQPKDMASQNGFNGATRHEGATSPAARNRAALTAFPQSTTSSALISIAGGIVRPSVSNVFLFITRRKRVGCSKGRSAGRAPRNIRSARSAARS
jgi:hypothetical protein